jgi:hypothetical protein
VLPVDIKQHNQRLAYSVRDFAAETSLSRSLIYEAIKAGDLQTIKLRGRRLILAGDGEAWIRSFRRGTQAASEGAPCP